MIRESLRTNMTSVWVGAGFSCLLSWIAAMFHSLGLYGFTEGGMATLNATYIISATSAAITLLTIGLFDKSSSRLLNSKSCFVLTPLAMTLSTLILPLCTNANVTGEVFIAVCGVSSGAASAIAILYVGLALCRLDLRQLIIALSIGQVGAAFLSTASQFAQGAASLAVAAAMPVVGTLAVACIQHGQPGSARDHAKLTVKVTTNDFEDGQRGISALVLRVSLCVLLIASTHEIARSLLIQMASPNHDGYSYLLTQMLIAIGSAVGSVGIALGLMNLKRLSMPRICHGAITILLLIGALSLPVPIIYPSIPSFVSVILDQISYFCFSFVLWVMAVVLCQRFARNKIRILAFVRLGSTLGAFVGLVIGRFVASNIGLSIGSIFACMLLAITIVFIAMRLIFSDTVFMSVMEIVPFSLRKRFQDKCQAVIEHYGLSGREAEIMMLFAKGRNLAYIQEELYLSRNTISTHRQHIYKKLGIHSQQELLDLIQNYDPYKATKG